MVALHEAEDAQDGMRLLKPTRPTRVPEIWQGGEGEGAAGTGKLRRRATGIRFSARRAPAHSENFGIAKSPKLSNMEHKFISEIFH